MTDVTEERGQAGPELSAADEQVLRELTERSRPRGLQLTGEGSVLAAADRAVPGVRAGRGDHRSPRLREARPGRSGTGNSRNGSRGKTVLTDVGPVEIGDPRDRDASFDPKIVAKRQRRLPGSMRWCSRWRRGADPR